MTFSLRYGALACLFAACIGHEPAFDPAADGGRIPVRECPGPAGTRGGCASGEICGSLPRVGYDYCMPALPCPSGMVAVLGWACAYPCSSGADCGEHGLSHCAENALAEYTDGPEGWCAP